MNVVIGEALVDVVAEGDRVLRETPGGSPLNVAVGVARLRGGSRLLTALAPDERGARLRRHLAAENVRVLEHPIDATSVARARIAADGAAEYDFEVSGEFDVSAAMAAELDAASAIHTGSVAAHLAPGADRILDSFVARAGRALLSYDPNCRPALMGDADAVRRDAERYVAAADVVKASDEDIRWLYPGESDAAVASRWIDLGAGLVVVTRGAEGAQAWHVSGAEATERPAPVRVVDTIGAGDSLMAALIVGLMSRGAVGFDARGALRAMSAGDLSRVLADAVRAAAVTCSREGADPPTAVELAASAARA